MRGYFDVYRNEQIFLFLSLKIVYTDIYTRIFLKNQKGLNKTIPLYKNAIAIIDKCSP